MAVEIGEETLFRYRIVSLVEALAAQDLGTSAAVRRVCDQAHDDHRQRSRRLSPRTVYRWLAAYRDGGIAALAPQPRPRLRGAGVLPEALLEFVAAQRDQDPRASIPELIERARQQGVIAPELAVERTTVWRAMKRRGIDTTRSRRQPDIDQRRFEYPQRLQMVLSDFKHFRAGAARLKRAAIYFLDDHSRYALAVTCATSEQHEVMLETLHRVLERYGRIDALYLDRGPAYIANALAEVCARLKIALVMGRARYPEGHGKIERFNQSLIDRVLESLRRPEVDPDCGALTLRLRHDLFERYNHLTHSSLDGLSPHQRFHDPGQRRLRPIESDALASGFVVSFERTVSADHIISVDGVAYEVPRGLRKQRIAVYRHLLERDDQGRPRLSVTHQRRQVRIQPVDKHFNAVSGRARHTDEPPADPMPPKSASSMAFERALAPMLDADGGYPQLREEDPDE